MTEQQHPDVERAGTPILLVGPSSPWNPDNPNVPNIVPDRPAAEPVKLGRVEEDTLIRRPDLAPDTYTLIAAGDESPAALAAMSVSRRRRTFDAQRPAISLSRRKRRPVSTLACRH